MKKVLVQTTNKLLNSTKKKIFNLKKTNWKYNEKKQRRWFKDKIDSKDVHFLLMNENKLIGYSCLRKTFYIYNSKKKNFKKKLYKCFVFDSFILEKKSRNFKNSSILMNVNKKIIKGKKRVAFLNCQKNHVNFYKFFGWRLVSQIQKKNLMYINKTSLFTYEEKKNIKIL